jgi:superfamily II DNA/RNA helicase
MRTKQTDHLHVPAEMIETGDQEHQDMTPGSTRLPPPVSVAAVVGGLSTQKQRRIISRGVDVLVATPGRLWDILQKARRSFFSWALNNEFVG